MLGIGILPEQPISGFLVIIGGIAAAVIATVIDGSAAVISGVAGARSGKDA